MSEPLPAAIAREAERIRSDGSLPTGFETQLRSLFEGIAADPIGLEAQARSLAQVSSPSASDGSDRRDRAARARQRLAVLDARSGGHLRTLRHRSVASATLLAERAALGCYVAADMGKRLAAGSVAEQFVARAVGSAADGVGPADLHGPGELLADAATTGDEDLDAFLAGRIATVTGPILHTESGRGGLVAKFLEMGLRAEGADPRVGERRSGSLEALARRHRASLGGLVLSGVPDRATPATARALTRLAASRVRPGGLLVIVSEHPARAENADPVASDLAPGRPLHPVTWCHLAARFGLVDAVIRESTAGDLYAIAASRP